MFEIELCVLYIDFFCFLWVLVEWWFWFIIVVICDFWVIDLFVVLGVVNVLVDELGCFCFFILDEVCVVCFDFIVCLWCGVKKLCLEVIEVWGFGVFVVVIYESGLGCFGFCLIEGV